MGGTFTWPDGRCFAGQWRDGKQDGEGIYTSRNDESRRGKWQAGKRICWISDDAAETKLSARGAEAASGTKDDTNDHDEDATAGRLLRKNSSRTLLTRQHSRRSAS